MSTNDDSVESLLRRLTEKGAVVEKTDRSALTEDALKALSSPKANFEAWVTWTKQN